MTHPARTTRTYRVTLRTPDGDTRDVDVEAKHLTQAVARTDKAWPGYEVLIAGPSPREGAS